MALERASGAVAALALLSLLPLPPARAAEPPPLPTVPRFAIAPSPIGLRGDVRPRQYLGVVGPRSAWLEMSSPRLLKSSELEPVSEMRSLASP